MCGSVLKAFPGDALEVMIMFMLLLHFCLAVATAADLGGESGWDRMLAARVALVCCVVPVFCGRSRGVRALFVALCCLCCRTRAWLFVMACGGLSARAGAVSAARRAPADVWGLWAAGAALVCAYVLPPR